MQKPTVAFIPIARKTFDISLAENVTRDAREYLESASIK